MRPAEVLREILYPLRDPTVLMAIVGFGSLLWLAAAGRWFGLWLAFIVVPAVFRYAIYLLEARAEGKKTLVAGVEIFNIADNLWGIFPLLLLVAFGLLAARVATTLSPLAAQALLLVFLLIYPASMAVLGITRSPSASVNPAALFGVVRACGTDYAWIPLVVGAISAGACLLQIHVLPGFALYFTVLYVFFLFFTLTGAIVNASGVDRKVEFAEPKLRSEEEVARGSEAERKAVATHAYGLISRGNREGGLKHIRNRVVSEDDPNAAVIWFFNEMMRWENKDAALYFGQEAFAHLLHDEKETSALKIVSSCLYAEPSWKPRSEDRQAAIEVAERWGRNDLSGALRGSAPDRS